MPISTSEPTASARFVPALLGLILLALLIRGVYFLEVRDQALFQEPTGDAATYLSLAQDLATEGLLAPSDAPYSMAPLYPGYLFALHQLGLGAGAARGMQFLLGAATVVLLTLIARRLGGSLAGWITGVVAAVYGPFVFFEAELLSISLAVFLLALSWFLWGRSRWPMLTGACLGLAALAQPNLLLIGLAGAIWSVARPAESGWRTRRAALLLAFGLLLPVGLTAARNLAVSGEPVLISTNGGINFYIGNNPVGDGTFHLPEGSGLVNRPEGLFTSARAAAEAASGRPLGASAVDRHWWFQGLDFWATRLPDAIALFGRKLLLTINHVEIPNHYDYAYFQSVAPVLRVLPGMAIIFPLGVVGLFLLWRRGRRLPTVVLAVLMISVALFFVTGRYRLPLALVLLPASGVALAALWELRREPMRLLYLIAPMVLLGTLSFAPLIQGNLTTAHMKNLEGTALYQQGDREGARRAFEAALNAQPEHAEALNNLGRVLLSEDPATALTYFQRALAADPTQAEAYLNLEEMYRTAGRNAEALDLLDRLQSARGGNLGEVESRVRYRRAVNAIAIGDTTRGEQELLGALRVEPTLTGGWVTLSMVYRNLGRFNDAAIAAERAVELLPDVAETQAALGAAYEGTENWAGAATAFRRVIDLGDHSIEMRFRTGRALLWASQPREAEPFLVAANEGQPHAESLWLLAQIYERTDRLEDAKLAYSALAKLPSPHAAAARDRLKALGVSRRQ